MRKASSITTPHNFLVIDTKGSIGGRRQIVHQVAEVFAAGAQQASQVRIIVTRLTTIPTCALALVEFVALDGKGGFSLADADLVVHHASLCHGQSNIRPRNSRGTTSRRLFDGNRLVDQVQLAPLDVDSVEWLCNRKCWELLPFAAQPFERLMENA